MSTRPPLSQYNVKQSSVNNNSNDRGAQLRSMLPTLLINVVVPFVTNMLAQPYMSTINALLLASAIPALFTLGNLIVKKRIDAIGMLVVASLLLTVVFALLFKNPRLLLLQSSAVSGLLGVVMLISLLFPRPALFYLVRSILAQNDAKRFASMNADWVIPQIRLFYRTWTAIWGCVTVAQLILLAVLVFILPISLMLVLSPILSFGILGFVAHWSVLAFRKNKLIFDQLRQQL